MNLDNQPLPEMTGRVPTDSVALAVDVLRTTPNRAAELVGPDLPRDLLALTDAEWRVIRHLKLGMSNKEIASILARSEATVKNQVASVLHKLRIPTRARLVAVLWCAELELADESLSARAPQPTAYVSGNPTHRREPQKIMTRWRGGDSVATS